MEFLDFETPVKDIIDQINKCKSIENESDVDITKTYNLLQKKLVETKKNIYSNLTSWQRVQLSRHPNRPYALDYINYLCGDSFLELHGDRNVKDDKAMIGGLGKINNDSFMFIGTQKGYNTKTRQYRNFGMANPEGYRKALRLMKKAEKFNIPIVTLIDTPGAYPGLEAEERGQGEAIARNIYEMMNIKVPIICIIIGEGASGGALGIGVGDKILMWKILGTLLFLLNHVFNIMENWEYKELAADALKLTANDMLKNKLIDKIIKEPLGGAHYDPEETFDTVRENIISLKKEITSISLKKMINNRRKKFVKIGNFKG